MITEKDLHEAIAECQGQRNPNASTCIKLASFYTILDHMMREMPKEEYSFASAPTYNGSVEYDSGTEFSDAIHGMDPYDILEVMDEAMTTLQVVNPRLYDGILRKLKQ